VVLNEGCEASTDLSMVICWVTGHTCKSYLRAYGRLFMSDNDETNGNR